jgi:hypothetical protein
MAFILTEVGTSVGVPSVLCGKMNNIQQVIKKTVNESYKQVKSVALQYPDIKVKVLEATSNEKWGPTGSQMAEIAQASYSYEYFPLIMETLWERINDDGKNWRHVYKGLLVLEYLLRSGSPDVIREARVKAIEIQTLKDFQHIDETGKDAGLSVRQKSKFIVELLSDEERLEEERQKVHLFFLFLFFFLNLFVYFFSPFLIFFVLLLFSHFLLTRLLKMLENMVMLSLMKQSISMGTTTDPVVHNTLVQAIELHNLKVKSQEDLEILLLVIRRQVKEIRSHLERNLKM